jgi:hypothetical protein
LFLYSNSSCPSAFSCGTTASKILDQLDYSPSCTSFPLKALILTYFQTTWHETKKYSHDSDINLQIFFTPNVSDC